jgi:hypothetical protein
MAARRLTDVLWFLTVALAGGAIGGLYAAHKAGGDETLAVSLYCGVLVVASAVCGALRPRNAAAWGLAVTLHQTAYVFTHPAEGGGMILALWTMWLAPFAAINAGVAAIAAAIVRRVLDKRYRLALAALAEQLGLKLSVEGELPSSGDHEPFFLFSEGEPERRRVRNVLRGTTHNIEVALFEFYCDPPKSSGSHSDSEGLSINLLAFLAYRERTVVWLDSPALGLPRLSVRPSWLGRGLQLVSVGLDLSRSPEFHRRYVVLGADPQGIQEALTEPVLDFLVARRGVGFEACGRQMIYYCDLVTASTERLRALLDEALALHDLLAAKRLPDARNAAP